MFVLFLFSEGSPNAFPTYPFETFSSKDHMILYMAYPCPSLYHRQRQSGDHWLLWYPAVGWTTSTRGLGARRIHGGESCGDGGGQLEGMSMRNDGLVGNFREYRRDVANLHRRLI